MVVCVTPVRVIEEEQSMIAHGQVVTRIRGSSAGDREQEPVRLWLLGGFRSSIGPRVIDAERWRLAKAANLIKLLGLAPRHRLHREQVMYTLWPDLDAKRASNNLHRTLHFARGVLEGAGADAGVNCLTLRRDLIELCPDGPIWVDVKAFENAARGALMGEEPAAFRAAISLYTGELLPENLYEDWAQERREDLRQLYKTLLVELGALYEERQDYRKGIQTLRSAVAQEPTDEDVHADLMRLYALSGRRLEALRQYERLRRTLSEELDTYPTGAGWRLYEQIRQGKLPITSPPLSARPSETPPPNNLTALLTSFIGRQEDVLGIQRDLSMTRLMTLTGAGGSGKTRLALEVARKLMGSYPGGVWLIELAPLSDPTLVSRAVAATLGVREQSGTSLMQTLRVHLASRRMLLVLDNCEHLVDAAARLAKDLLGACPELTILATSREPLNVSGETIWPVPTLSLPDLEALTVEDLMGAEAVRLFVERARSRLLAFELTEENARAVARVCLELDGIPLAIELSTARMGTLAVEQVAQRLEASLGLLSGGDRTVAPRHQTLRATLDWSYELLGQDERALFRRLSVFAGGWTLEASEAVGAGDGIEEDEVLDLLSQLVNKSMVVVEGDGLRYGMLEPIRRYGMEQLGASVEADAVRRRHACWYFELAKEVEPWSRGARQEVWLEQLEREYGNLRAALSWALERGEVDPGLWFGGALAEFWYMSGNLGEGRRWLEAALAKCGDASPTPARIKALVRAGWIAWEQGDCVSSVAMSEEGLMLSREIGDMTIEIAALTNLGWAALLSDDLERASALAEEAIALGRTLGDSGGVARALLITGLATVASGDHEHALKVHEESLALARKAGDDVAAALSLGMGVFASLGQGAVQLAQALCEQSLAIPPQPRILNACAFQLRAAATLAAAQELPARSARLWGAAESLQETIGAALSPVELRVHGPYIKAARQDLGEVAWEVALTEGKAMTVEEAEAYAEREDRERPRRVLALKAPQQSRQHDQGLTRRQREIALLVARGLSNRQIASELTISQNTVANHVASIARKLNAPSRSRIAVWVTERGLREVG
jgi:predicted ATPase/DNA-binding SARP family transcriptional activator/DNA-binding CsgD family transcriptional regulator